MQETRRVSTLQKTWLREDGTGAAHHVVGTSWSVGWVTTAETITKKNKSRGLNKLQKAQCPSKETRRGLQLPSKRVLSHQISPLWVKHGVKEFSQGDSGRVFGHRQTKWLSLLSWKKLTQFG